MEAAWRRHGGGVEAAWGRRGGCVEAALRLSSSEYSGVEAAWRRRGGSVQEALRLSAAAWKLSGGGVAAEYSRHPVTLWAANPVSSRTEDGPEAAHLGCPSRRPGPERA